MIGKSLDYLYACTRKDLGLSLRTAHVSITGQTTSGTRHMLQAVRVGMTSEEVRSRENGGTACYSTTASIR